MIRREKANQLPQTLVDPGRRARTARSLHSALRSSGDPGKAPRSRPDGGSSRRRPRGRGSFRCFRPYVGCGRRGASEAPARRRRGSDVVRPLPRAVLHEEDLDPGVRDAVGDDVGRPGYHQFACPSDVARTADEGICGQQSSSLWREFRRPPVPPTAGSARQYSRRSLRVRAGTAWSTRSAPRIA